MLTLNELTIAIEIGIIYGILALGIYLTFRTINFPDLTCDGSFVTGAAVSSVIIKSGLNPMVGLFFAMLAGGTAGLLTGFINIRLKVEDLLSGIIVAFMLYSINLRIMGTNPNISLVNETTIFCCGNLSSPQRLNQLKARIRRFKRRNKRKRSSISERRMRPNRIIFSAKVLRP